MEDGTLFADGFDNAIIGICTESEVPRVVYDKDLMIDELMNDGLAWDEAYEYLEFNTWNVYVGKGTPIYIQRMTKSDIYDSLQE